MAYVLGWVANNAAHGVPLSGRTNEMSKGPFAKHMDSHWRYANAPKKFKWWFGKIEWKRSRHKLNERRDDKDKRFNKILRRYGLAHLQIIRLENREQVLGERNG